MHRARLFYASPECGTLDSCVSKLDWRARLSISHGVATALWTLHSLGECYSQRGDGVLQQLSETTIGVSADGKAEVMGLGLSSLGGATGDKLQDLEQLGRVLRFIVASPLDSPEPLAYGLPGQIEETGWPEGLAELLHDMVHRCCDCGSGNLSPATLLQDIVTKLAHVLIEHGRAVPSRLPCARQAKRWVLLRNVLRASWALRGSLEALCCVCLEPSEKSKGLLCPTKHKNPLLCFDCLEPYVCSLIGTSELRRQEGVCRAGQQ